MKTISGKDISKIGIGSFGIGGKGHRDVEITEKAEDNIYIEALAHALERGANFLEISLGYGWGESIKLFKKALDQSSIKREDVFITHSLYTRDLDSIETMDNDASEFYKIMDTDYADSTLVTQSLILKFGKEKVYEWLHNLITTNKTRYVSLSNSNLDNIRDFKEKFGDKFFAHEGHLSFEVRSLEDKGVFNLCDELNVTNIIWRPLRRNKTLSQNWELLEELSQKYNKSKSQIVLNWICKLGYRPMVFSTSKKHIDENMSATDFEMTSEDYLRMTNFRPEGYKLPDIEWDGQNIDNDIVAQVNNFESFKI